MQTLPPLTDELHSYSKGPDKLSWLETMETAFSSAKQSLLSAMHMAHLVVGAELSLVVDTLATHLRVCLQQRKPGKSSW